MDPSPTVGWGCRSLVDLKELQHSAVQCRLRLAYVRNQTHTFVDRRHSPKRRRRRRLCTLQTHGRARKSTQVQNQRLERMKNTFDEELAMMRREYDAEKTYMVTRHRQQIEELKDTYVAFDKYFLQKEQTARCEYGSIRDEMKNKAIENKHALRMTLEKKVDALWAEFTTLKTNYLKATEGRRAHYEVLRKRNCQSLKDIENQMSHLKTVNFKIVAAKAHLGKIQEEFKEKNRLLGDERERLSAHFLDLKRQINELRNRQLLKLTDMVNVSNSVHNAISEMVKQANIIIGLGEKCRYLESEEEKVLPFYVSCLTQEDERQLADACEAEEDAEIRAMLKLYEPLDIFWRRFSKVQLEKLALLKERQILEVENRHLKTLVAQYLENLSVNEKVMSKPNSLLVINGKHNLVVDPAMRDGKKRPVATVKLEGALMVKDGVISCLEL
ncbi:Dynein regulatory complex subunit 2 [Taenia crassiceps]|uniref:Dynein regulatory complex subunit 2 n=1 Tax=Taenia crassiceps TaxID=6207 RepID=A0ABR4QK01_9CEST